MSQFANWYEVDKQLLFNNGRSTWMQTAPSLITGQQQLHLNSSDHNFLHNCPLIQPSVCNPMCLGPICGASYQSQCYLWRKTLLTFLLYGLIDCLCRHSWGFAEWWTEGISVQWWTNLVQDWDTKSGSRRWLTEMTDLETTTQSFLNGHGGIAPLVFVWIDAWKI